jgi:hypothetical protein
MGMQEEHGVNGAYDERPYSAMRGKGFKWPGFAESPT